MKWRNLEKPGEPARMASKEVERPKEQGVGKCQGWQGAPDITFGAVPADLAIILPGTLAKVAEEGWVEAKTNS